jgi:hypothetical protein
MTDIFTGIPRGVTRRGGRQLTLEEQAMPMATFTTEDSIGASRLLRHDGRKIVLGTVAAN